jgi:hypothetical protein
MMHEVCFVGGQEESLCPDACKQQQTAHEGGYR